MSKDIIKQLKNLRHGGINPQPEWVVANRAMLLSQIKNTVPTKNQLPLWQKFARSFSFAVSHYSMLRPITALVLVAVVVSGTWNAFADAALDAVPGDLVFYPVKRAAEKTQSEIAQLVGGPKEEIRLHTEFANRRLKEIQKITSDQSVKKDLISQSVADLSNELSRVRQNLDKIQDQSGGGQEAVAAGKALDNTSVQLKDVLSQVNNNEVSSSTNNDLSNQIAETNNLAKDTALKALEVAVAKHLNGDEDVSRDQVNVLVKNNLNAAVNDINSSKDAINGINTLVANVQTQVNSEIKNLSEFATSSKNLTAQIASLVKTTNQALVNADQKVNEVASSTQITQNLVSQGDLSQVVNSLKDAHEVAKEVELLSISTQEQAQLLIPIVQNSSSSVSVSTSTQGASSTLLIPILLKTMAATNSVTTSTSSNVVSLPTSTLLLSTSTLSTTTLSVSTTIKNVSTTPVTTTLVNTKK